MISTKAPFFFLFALRFTTAICHYLQQAASPPRYIHLLFVRFSPLNDYRYCRCVTAFTKSQTAICGLRHSQ